MRDATTRRLLRAIIPAIAAAWGAACPAGADVTDFEDVGATLPARGYWNGDDLSGTLDPGGGDYGEDIWVGGFTSGNLDFSNVYSAFDAWQNWAYSSTVDTTTPGFTNQYSAMTGGGAGGSATYGLGYGFTTLAVPSGMLPVSADVVNTTYAYLAIRDGNDGVPTPPGPFVTEFTTGDSFLLEIAGYDDGTHVDTVPFYLADYRNYTPGDNDDDYIATDWTTVDLSPLAGATELQFSLTTTDWGEFGPNTPTYFAIDNIVTAPVPEPGTLALLLAAAAAGLVRRRRRR